MESVHAQQGIVVDFKKARAGFLRFALTQHAQNAQNTFVASQQCAHESNSWLSVSILWILVTLNLIRASWGKHTVRSHVPMLLLKATWAKKTESTCHLCLVAWTGYICTINSVYLIPSPMWRYFLPSLSCFTTREELMTRQKQWQCAYQANELQIAAVHKWPTSTHCLLVSVWNERNKVGGT